jgi:uncharacterized protein (TIGR00369 family)
MGFRLPSYNAGRQKKTWVMTTVNVIDLSLVDTWMRTLFAPWVQQLGLSLETIEPGHVSFALPVTPAVCREGGSLSGQAMMAAADTAMVIAIAAQLGQFKPLTTVSLTSHFLRPVMPSATGSARVVARVIKPGRSMMFGEMEVFTPENKLAAQFLGSYALLDV